ncbi:hypothetical protein MASR2M29_20390 [Spirochaetota bacterium]
MKKMLPCLAVLLFVSCMTGRMHDAFYSADGLGLPVFFQIANVSVQLDHLEEASLAGQVRTMGDTFLLARQNACHESAVKFYIDLSISQRSFTQGSNFYNSIFIACTVRNSAGKVLALENECISGYRSIENSSCLGKILNRILKRVISAFGNAKNAIAWMGAQKGKKEKLLACCRKKQGMPHAS